MSQSYYEGKLYPLQARALDILGRVDTDFYLTGDTALNRAYVNFRYSDDLDFFLNQSDGFARQVEMCLNALRSGFPNVETAITYDSFARLFIIENDVSLKIEFVNDVAFRYGSPQKSDVFVRTDNIRNILSNKISALSRDEAKDIADIWQICLTAPFSWKEIIEEAKMKDLWVDEIEAAMILNKFDISRFESLKWRISWDPALAKAQIDKISRELLMGMDNTLLT